MKLDNDTKSFVTSPIVIWIGLLKIYFASKGSTREALAEALSLRFNSSVTQLALEGIISNLTALKEKVPSLRWSNDLYHSSDIVPEYEFEELMRKTFHSSALSLDSNKPSVLADLNKKMEPKFGRQPSVRLEGEKNGTLVLVDTAGFSINWSIYPRKCFRPEFNLLPTGRVYPAFVWNHVDVTMITRRLGSHLAKYRAFLIPLKDTTENFYLMIISPDQRELFYRLGQTLDYVRVLRVLLTQGEASGDPILLPTFNISTSVDITEYLKQVGKHFYQWKEEMTFGRALGKEADLHAMTKSRTTGVNSFLQNVDFQLGPKADEPPGLCPPLRKSWTFVGNSPFLFAIVAGKDDPVVLLTGRYTGT